MLAGDTRHTKRKPILFKKEVRQNIKDKRDTEELGMEACSKEGVMKEGKFPNSRKPSHQWACGEFWSLRGQHNQEKRKEKTHRIGT